jgi:hypothetical protein
MVIVEIAIPGSVLPCMKHTGVDWRIMRYVVTWAQNDTPIHAGFFQSLRRYCRARKAELKVIPGRYQNPTSVWTSKDRDATWAEAIHPFLVTGREKLCRNLTLYGEVKIRPTAGRPLTGFETFCGGTSGIFGHPKRAWETVATDTRMPRILVTTGAITRRNYTDSKEGHKGHHHHVYGALIVEIEPSGRYHLRHIGADSEGRFFDLDRRYTPDGIYKSARVPALTLGDLHVAHKDQVCSDGTDRLIKQLRPQRLFLHDVLDMESGNPHDRGLRKAFDKRGLSVRQELQAACEEVHRLAQLVDEVTVLRANHDDMLDRWFESFVPERDPKNADFYFELGALLFRARQEGKWPGAFGAWFDKHFGEVNFPDLNDRVTVGGVAYGFHGHRGLAGGKGTLGQFARLGVKTVTGHGHAPGIRDGAYRVGVGSKLDHGYNTLPSNWLQAHCVQYPDHRRSLIPMIEGNYTY